MIHKHSYHWQPVDTALTLVGEALRSRYMMPTHREHAQDTLRTIRWVHQCCGCGEFWMEGRLPPELTCYGHRNGDC